MMTYQWLESVPGEQRTAYTGSTEKLVADGLLLHQTPVAWATIDFANEVVRGQTSAGAFFKIGFEAPNPFQRTA